MNTYGDHFVMVDRDRYDELLHKEALLDNIEKLFKLSPGYSFRDVVGCLLTEKENDNG